MPAMNDQYVLPTYGRAPFDAARGEGSYLYDTEGRRYVDFCAGIATCSLGHCNSVVVKALTEQAHTLMHCSNLYGIPGQAKLAELVVEKLIGIPGRVFFCNSGAEGNEGMIKTARRFGHRRPAADGTPRYEVITFNKSFHGRGTDCLFSFPFFFFSLLSGFLSLSPVFLLLVLSS